MARRSRAREVVLQMLFQRDLNPDVDIRDVRSNMVILASNRLPERAKVRNTGLA